MTDPAIHKTTLLTRLRALWPLGPIFNKELRQMARRKRSYILRFCYLGVLLGVLSITWIGISENYSSHTGSLVQQAQRQAQMGNIFFAVFTMFSITAMHLIGPVLTSTAIGSERLNRTLDVLLMTPISSWQLVAGKLFSRLFTALMLLGLSLPVLAIVRLLGGVELEDMFGALALAASVAMSSAAMGLLLSCWMKRSWAVILMSYLLQAAIFFIIPMTVMVAVMNNASGTRRMNYSWVVQFLSSTNPLYTAAARSLSGGTAFSDWWYACYVQIIFAAFLTLLAAIVVRRIGRRQSGGRGATTDIPLPPAPEDLTLPPPLPALQYEPKARAAPARMINNSPILWRELRQPLFPKLWQRIVAVVAVVGMLLFSYWSFGFGSNALRDDDIHIGYAFIFHTLLAMIAIVLAATAIATEKESDTWTLLIVSPVSGRAVVMGKFYGVFRRLFWPWLLMVLHFALFTLLGVLSIWSTLSVLWIALTFNIIWIATGLYLSLRVRKVTTAVVFNLMLPIIAYALIPILIAVISPSRSYYGGNGWDFSETSFYWLPYWYLAMTVHELSSGGGLYSSPFTVPVFRDSWPTIYLVYFTFVAGLIQVGLAAAILWYSSTRFDKIVGRAGEGSREWMFSPSRAAAPVVIPMPVRRDADA